MVDGGCLDVRLVVGEIRGFWDGCEVARSIVCSALLALSSLAVFGRLVYMYGCTIVLWWTGLMGRAAGRQAGEGAGRRSVVGWEGWERGCNSKITVVGRYQ